MKKTTKIIRNVVSWVLICLVLAILVLTAGVKVVGLTPYSVLSGSMEPNFHVGSLIYVKSISTDEIKVGDPITFYLNGSKTVATHRVVSIDKQANQIITKGDANKNNDLAPVGFSNVIGKAVFTVPLLGYLTAFLSQTTGKIVAVCAAILLIVFFVLPDMLAKAKEADAKEEREKQMKNDPLPEKANH